MRRGWGLRLLGVAGAMSALAACGPKSPASAAAVDAGPPADAAVVRDAAAPLDVAMPPDWWARTYRLAAAGQPDEAGMALLLALERDPFPVPKAREAFHDPRLAQVMKNPVVRSRLSRMGVRVPEVDANLQPRAVDGGVRDTR